MNMTPILKLSFLSWYRSGQVKWHVIFLICALFHFFVSCYVFDNTVSEMIEGTNLKIFPVAVCSVSFISFVLVDALTKLLFLDINLAPNDGIRTKPIRDIGYGTMVFLKVLSDIYTYIYLLILCPIVFVLLPSWIAVAMAILMLLISIIDSLFILSAKNSDTVGMKIVLYCSFLMYIVLFLGMMFYGFLSGNLAIIYHMIILGVFCLCFVLFMAVRLAFYWKEGNSHVDTVLISDSINSNMDWCLLRRTKKFKGSIIYMLIACVFNGYLLAVMNATEEIFACLGIFFSQIFPLLLGGFGFINADGPYMAGLATKPYTVSVLLCRKYRTMVLFVVFSTLLMLPGLWNNTQHLILLVASSIFSVGILSKLTLLLILQPFYVELYPSAMSFEKRNMKPLLMCYLIFLVVLVPYICLLVLCDVYTTAGIIGSLGLFGTVFNKVFIHYLASLYAQNKYKCLEINL